MKIEGSTFEIFTTWFRALTNLGFGAQDTLYGVQSIPSGQRNKDSWQMLYYLMAREGAGASAFDQNQVTNFSQTCEAKKKSAGRTNFYSKLVLKNG